MVCVEKSQDIVFLETCHAPDTIYLLERLDVTLREKCSRCKCEMHHIWGCFVCHYVILFTHLSPEVGGSSEVVRAGQRANETAIVIE